jgi:hypothetical protein
MDNETLKHRFCPRRGWDLLPGLSHPIIISALLHDFW